MIEIDGSDGGGQLVRSAIALSLLDGEPVRIEAIRGARSEPGLKAQHLAVVEVAAEIGAATVDGAELGSTELVFEPDAIDPGTYDVDVGTAGSLTLVFDALLPLAATIDEPLSVTARGGTDVRWSPPFEYARSVKLPLLRALGWGVAVDLDRRGFYPNGGGRATLSVYPSKPDPVALSRPIEIDRAHVHSVASEELADAEVADRQADAAVEALADAGVQVLSTTVETAVADCPGSAVVVRSASETGAIESVAGADALGEPGTPAEEVGKEAATELLGLSDGAVDEYLADQLLLPLALSGGELLVPRMTDHVRTSLDLLDRFGYEISAQDHDGGRLLSA